MKTLLFVLTFLICGNIYSQSTLIPKERDNKMVNSLGKYPKEIAEIIFSKSKDFPNNTQLSIALIENGETTYYGIIKENDTLKPAENQKKIFEIGSITKVFTSTILASLVDHKKINLTDEINSYYPFAFKDNIKINFESLANHTSGLPRLPENLDLSNEINPYKNYGKPEIEQYLKNLLKLGNKTYSYSNLGTGLLGYTLGLSQKTNFQKSKNKLFSLNTINLTPFRPKSNFIFVNLLLIKFWDRVMTDYIRLNPTLTAISQNLLNSCCQSQNFVP